jgi:hypothetical protein
MPASAIVSCCPLLSLFIGGNLIAAGIAALQKCDKLRKMLAVSQFCGYHPAINRVRTTPWVANSESKSL